jgi:hypothetical protein
MARLLGSSTRANRQGGRWSYCCVGHDGYWKDYIRQNRKSQRHKENRTWRKEQETE